LHDALIVIDVINTFEHDDGDALLASFRQHLPLMMQAICDARANGVPVVYVNDADGRWDGDATSHVRSAVENGRGGDVVGPLAPARGDEFIFKPRYSTFDSTPLAWLLRNRATDRILLMGAATEGCVVQSGIDGRELGFKVTILAAACASPDEELERIALAYAERVGGIRVVRTIEGTGFTPGQPVNAEVLPIARSRRSATMTQSLNSLEGVLQEQIEDLLSAERQLIQALPKVAEAANSRELKEAFETHLDQTRGHVERLEEVFDELGLKRSSTTCKAMQGLVAEGDEIARMKGDPVAKDAALIAAAQRIEHYEIAAYGTAKTLAAELNHRNAERLLEATLDEESAADRLLTKIATGGLFKSGLNQKAASS
jgi:ferritin-like metal-binding protein YciE/nicotinamidase-related amidase